MTAATARRHPLNMTADGSFAMPGQEVFVVRRSEDPYVEAIDRSPVGRVQVGPAASPFETPR
ncbi:hypothetical protein SAMN04487980_1015161 [Streptomyces sp. cf124]|uniref:hypothetical protein n=1 Tax=unclassified Streptomyces TaxID=2593676 RepID=UPI0005F058B6|nr:MULTISPECIES: hypothetical protein [unclassified Streptomyces]SFN28314.1 hypothetical protein SAMN04487980_1015161 [Streptomyces sp. cf124]